MIVQHNTLTVLFTSSLHAWRADEFWGTLSRISRVFQDDHAIPYHDLLSAVWWGVSCTSWGCKLQSNSFLLWNFSLPYLLLLIHNIISLHGWAHRLPEVHWLLLSLRVFLENVNFRWWGFSCFQMCIPCRSRCIRMKKTSIQ